MTRPRSHIAPHHSPGAFHCVQRCVRRAFLCGIDSYSGLSFEHRRGWIEQRIRLVADCFAVAIDAYAVMSNHLHLVLRIDPGEALHWSDDEVKPNRDTHKSDFPDSHISSSPTSHLCCFRDTEA